MTGSQEVMGSIPTVSTKKGYTFFRDVYPFFVERIVGVERRLLAGRRWRAATAVAFAAAKGSPPSPPKKHIRKGVFFCGNFGENLIRPAFQRFQLLASHSLDLLGACLSFQSVLNGFKLQLGDVLANILGLIVRRFRTHILLRLDLRANLIFTPHALTQCSRTICTDFLQIVDIFRALMYNRIRSSTNGGRVDLVSVMRCMRRWHPVTISAVSFFVYRIVFFCAYTPHIPDTHRIPLIRNNFCNDGISVDFLSKLKNGSILARSNLQNIIEIGNILIYHFSQRDILLF